MRAAPASWTAPNTKPTLPPPCPCAKCSAQHGAESTRRGRGQFGGAGCRVGRHAAGHPAAILVEQPGSAHTSANERATDVQCTAPPAPSLGRGSGCGGGAGRWLEHSHRCAASGRPPTRAELGPSLPLVGTAAPESKHKAHCFRSRKPVHVLGHPLECDGGRGTTCCGAAHNLDGGNAATRLPNDPSLA